MIPPQKAVVFLHGGIPDAIKCLPPLRGLREAWPDARVAFAVRRMAGELLDPSGQKAVRFLMHDTAISPTGRDVRLAAWFGPSAAGGARRDRNVGASASSAETPVRSTEMRAESGFSAFR